MSLVGTRPILPDELEQYELHHRARIAMGDKIMNHFGDGSKLGVSIQYYNEITPLGNAGALFKLREQLGEG